MIERRIMRLRYLPILLSLVVLLGFGNSVFAQIQIGDDLSAIDYARPQKYEIGAEYDCQSEGGRDHLHPWR